MNDNIQMPVTGLLGFRPLQLLPPPTRALHSLNNVIARGLPYRGGFNQLFRRPNPLGVGLPYQSGFNQSFRGPNPRGVGPPYAGGFNPSFRRPNPSFSRPFRRQLPRGGFNPGLRGRSKPENSKMSQEMDGNADPVPVEQIPDVVNSSGNGEDCDAKFYLPEGGATAGENANFKRRPKPWQQKKTQGPNKAKPKLQLRCTICDLSLTSDTVAEQHYKGRRHRLAASNGYYNPEGKWVHKATECEALRNANAADSNLEAAVPGNTVPVELYCSICMIRVTCKYHMGLHLAGSKHAKKLKQLASAQIDTDDANLAARTDQTIFPNSVEGGDSAQQDHSMHRTAPKQPLMCSFLSSTRENELMIECLM